MKKFLLGLMTFLGMAVGFTACGDDDSTDSEQPTATESGATLYDSYTEYKEADATTTAGALAKAEAALNLYNTYQAFQTNKEDKTWIKEFAASAALSYLGVDAEETSKTAVAESLLSTLTESSLVSETASTKVEAVAGLASELSTIFSK